MFDVQRRFQDSVQQHDTSVILVRRSSGICISHFTSLPMYSHYYYYYCFNCQTSIFIVEAIHRYLIVSRGKTS